MSASEDLDKVTINNLRVVIIEACAAEHISLVITRDQLLREVGSKFYGRFPKKGKVRR